MTTNTIRPKFIKLDAETLRLLKLSFGRIGPASRGKKNFIQSLSDKSAKILKNYVDINENDVKYAGHEYKIDSITLNTNRQKGKFPVTILAAKKINKTNKSKIHEKRRVQKKKTIERKLEQKQKYSYY